MKLSSYTLALLDDIERRIDSEVEEDYRAQWQAFWSGEVDEPVFCPTRKRTAAPSIEVKPIHINDAQGDLELMLDYELMLLSHRVSSPTSSLGIRANYGVGIIPTMFGAELFEMPRETNTLPTSRAWNDSDRIREMLERGMPDLYAGLGKNVLDFGELCVEVFAEYPSIRRYVDIFHPDTQGPLDLAELLWGGEMFYEMYDDPDFVHAALRLITDTYKAFMDKWFATVPPRGEIASHWSIMHRGTILLRLDSAMNLSPDFYNAFSKPYDSELLAYYGGGCMHFCGRGDHYIDSLCEIEHLYGINMSQPELNDMSKIFGAVTRNGKRIFGFPRAAQYVHLLGDKTGVLQ